ncbi:MAG: hypothetical protein AAGA30_12090, partial [Planctomycetota bacterium]
RVSSNLSRKTGFATTIGKVGKQNANDISGWLFVDLEYWISTNSTLAKMFAEVSKKDLSVGCVLYKTSNGVFEFKGRVAGQGFFENELALLNLAPELVGLSPVLDDGWTSRGGLKVRKENVLPAVANLFDRVIGEGEVGLFDAVIDDLRDEPDGPQIDIRKDLVGRIKSDCYFVSDRATNRLCILIPVANSLRVSHAIDAFYKDDPKADKIRLTSFTGWNVQPIGDSAIGIRSPYIIGLWRNYIIVASDKNSIRKLQLRKEPFGLGNNQKYDVDNELHSFAYELNLNRFFSSLDRNDLASLFGKTRNPESIQDVWNRFRKLRKNLNSEALLLNAVTESNGLRFFGVIR